MLDYESVLAAASQLSVPDRLKLIDQLASSVPNDQPPQLSVEWITELARRSKHIDDGGAMENWSDVRAPLFTKHGVDLGN